MTRAASLLLFVGLAAAVGCGPTPTTPTTPTTPAPPTGPSDDEAREIAKKNLKAIGVALHKYESGRQAFPAASTTVDGKGLSWRVQILPFLGKDGEALWLKFHQYEPWDSPHNKTLIDQMPAVFASPGKPAEKGQTHLRGFIGQGAYFPTVPRAGAEVPTDFGVAAGDRPSGPSTAPKVKTAHGRRFIDATDGTSNTLLVAEWAEPVIWTKADELEYDERFDRKERPPLPKLGGVFAGGFHGLMADGQVMFFPNELTNDDLLRRAILLNDFTNDTKPEEYLFLNTIRQANGVELHKPFVPYRPSTSPTVTKPSETKR